MKVNYQGTTYLFQFSHINNHKFPKTVEVDGKRYKRELEESFTICKIYIVEDNGNVTVVNSDHGRYENPVFEKILEAKGVAICSPEDQFVKDKGRRLALKKALKELRYSIDFRVFVWKQYNLETRKAKK
jgi:hypothetical protein